MTRRSCPAFLIGLVPEGDLAVFDRRYPVIGDGGFMGVPSEVFDHVVRSGKGPFSVDDPFFAVAFFLQIIGQADGFGFCQCLEPRHEFSPKDLPHGGFGEEVFAVGTGRFPLSAPGQSATGHDGVHMRMEAQLLPPGVQNGGHTRLCTQVFWVICEGIDGLPGGAEEEAVHGPGVLQTKRVEFVRQGEHEVEIRHLEQFLFLSCDPHFPLERTAGRAVAVATGVVADFVKGALFKGVHMSAQIFGAALFDGI